MHTPFHSKTKRKWNFTFQIFIHTYNRLLTFILIFFQTKALPWTSNCRLMTDPAPMEPYIAKVLTFELRTLRLWSWILLSLNSYSENNYDLFLNKRTFVYMRYNSQFLFFFNYILHLYVILLSFSRIAQINLWGVSNCPGYLWTTTSSIQTRTNVGSTKIKSFEQWYVKQQYLFRRNTSNDSKCIWESIIDIEKCW